MLAVADKGKLKPEVFGEDRKSIDGINVFLNPKYLMGDNAKFQKMYDWMSRGYDFVETWVGKFKYGNAVQAMRRKIISALEWKNGVSVLYVSIGTGRNLDFIPSHIDASTLEIYGVDISLGMLRKCGKKFSKSKLRVSLWNCCAEDLPFADNAFDIVFHVGGINFFNDKALAIREMLRVAKPGTKLLVADETGDYVKSQYQKSALSKSQFKGLDVDLREIEAAIPEEIRERRMELLWENRFYCLEFRKPG